MSIIEVPDELAHELDRLAGTLDRSAYAVDILWREVRRARQRAALQASSGHWTRENHPELAEGGAARVEAIRSERDTRFEEALGRQT